MLGHAVAASVRAAVCRAAPHGASSHSGHTRQGASAGDRNDEGENARNGLANCVRNFESFTFSWKGKRP